MAGAGPLLLLLLRRRENRFSREGQEASSAPVVEERAGLSGSVLWPMEFARETPAPVFFGLDEGSPDQASAYINEYARSLPLRDGLDPASDPAVEDSCVLAHLRLDRTPGGIRCGLELDHVLPGVSESGTLEHLDLPSVGESKEAQVSFGQMRDQFPAIPTSNASGSPLERIPAHHHITGRK